MAAGCVFQHYEENMRADQAQLLTASRPVARRQRTPVTLSLLLSTTTANKAANQLGRLLYTLPPERQNELLTDLARVNISTATLQADATGRHALHQLPFERLAHYRCWFLQRGFPDLFAGAHAGIGLSWPQPAG